MLLYPIMCIQFKDFLIFFGGKLFLELRYECNQIVYWWFCQIVKLKDLDKYVFKWVIRQRLYWKILRLKPIFRRILKFIIFEVIFIIFNVFYYEEININFIKILVQLAVS